MRLRQDGERWPVGQLAGAALVAMVTILAPCLSRAVVMDHQTWDRLLSQYVDEEGRVAYADLRRQDSEALERYLEQLATADPESAPAPDAQAFWINAYNAGVFAAVLGGYTAENFLRRRSFFKGFEFQVAGKERTLDEIEHQIIRRRFKDPRTHFVLVCASSSCPRLRRGAYLGRTLDSALDEEARRFINDPERNRIDPNTGSVKLSAIFKWFAEDFAGSAGSVEEFVASYLTGAAERAAVRAETTSIDYLDYDWTLNARPGQRP